MMKKLLQIKLNSFCGVCNKYVRLQLSQKWLGGASGHVPDFLACLICAFNKSQYWISNTLDGHGKYNLD